MATMLLSRMKTLMLLLSREHIRIVVPSPHKKAHTVATLREELSYTGLSVIIARRACVNYAKEIKDIKEARELKREIKVVAA